jgi:hypothetical protein
MCLLANSLPFQSRIKRRLFEGGREEEEEENPTDFEHA